MFGKEPVATWAKMLDEADIPHDYNITYGAFFLTMLSIMFPFDIGYSLGNFLIFHVLPANASDFIKNEYGPELKTAISQITIKLADRIELIRRFTGMIIKLLYAFFWQEWTIPQAHILYHPIPEAIGGMLVPYVNQLADAISGVPQTDPVVTNAWNVYPGVEQCRGGDSPHATWHEMSANGFLEYAFLADYIHMILS